MNDLRHEGTIIGIADQSSTPPLLKIVGTPLSGVRTGDTCIATHAKNECIFHYRMQANNAIVFIHTRKYVPKITTHAKIFNFPSGNRTHILTHAQMVQSYVRSALLANAGCTLESCGSGALATASLLRTEGTQCQPALANNEQLSLVLCRCSPPEEVANCGRPTIFKQ